MIFGLYSKYTLYNDRRQMLFCISGDTTLSFKLLAIVVIGQTGEHYLKVKYQFATWHIGHML